MRHASNALAHACTCTQACRRSSFMTSVNKSYEEKKQVATHPRMHACTHARNTIACTHDCKGKLDGYVVVSDSDMDALIECSRAVCEWVCVHGLPCCPGLHSAPALACPGLHLPCAYLAPWPALLLSLSATPHPAVPFPALPPPPSSLTTIWGPPYR